MNRKGQVFVNLVVFSLALMIFIFAAPIVGTIIGESVGGMGTATAFVVKAFLWILILIFAAVFFRIISSGEGFFA